MIRRKGRFTGRVLAAALFLTFAASSVNAYTLVMRNGRRVEIPNTFTVSGSTVTYEVGSGVQVTIQLSTIDIGATELANGEPAGSFLSKSATPAPAAGRPRQTRPTATRSITNADLEEYRRTRIASERAYEKRRKTLGLPTAQDSQRELAAVGERTHEQLRNKRGQEQEDETYWRGRAASLRTEIAANTAQIDFVRGRLDELPQTSNPFETTGPFGTLGIPSVDPWYIPFPSRRRSGPFGRNNRRRTGIWNPPLVVLPPQTPDHTFERETLTNQLNDLLMQRAALGVRWKELEEEARRAGAYPGWLRP